MKKIALVTGSTQGIGLGIASAFARQGYHVAINGLGGGQEVADQLSREHKVDTFFHPADLSKPNEIADLVAQVRANLGDIDVLVNNAGVQYVAPLASYPEERWDLLLAVNLSAVFHTTRLVLPRMTERGWGRIINVSSVHGLVGSRDKSAYCAAKHGVQGLTKVTALETAGTGVTCNTINPGWVLTPLVEKQIREKSEEWALPFEDAKHRLLMEKQPSGEFVSVDALAQAALFLCSDASSQITGTNLTMDGGWTAQ